MQNFANPFLLFSFILHQGWAWKVFFLQGAPSDWYLYRPVFLDFLGVKFELEDFPLMVSQGLTQPINATFSFVLSVDFTNSQSHLFFPTSQSKLCCKIEIGCKVESPYVCDDTVHMYTRRNCINVTPLPKIPTFGGGLIHEKSTLCTELHCTGERGPGVLLHFSQSWALGCIKFRFFSKI